ncbi:MAG: PAS domain S-box protein, partial [bacterium]|nr:PAS domain S-box protein [bacterium]
MNTKHDHLIEGKYTFRDLVDIERLQKMFDGFSGATRFTAELFSYPQKELLISTGRNYLRDKFHRAFPISEAFCKQTKQILYKHIEKQEERIVHLCKNGLVEGATPIIVNGAHVGDIFTGRVLFRKPDIEFYRKQAVEIGYDLNAYLKEITDVPVLSEEEFKKTMYFLAEMAVLLAQQSLNEIRNREATQTARDNTEAMKLFRSAVDASTDAVGMSTPEGAHWYQNEAFDRMFGDIGNDPPATVYVDQAVGRDVFGTIMAGKTWIGETQMNGANNKILDVLLRAYPVHDKEGKRISLIGVHTDITKRKQNENELRQLRNYLTNIIDSMPSLLIGVDATGNVTQWNKAAELNTGLDAGTAQGKHLSHVFPRIASNKEKIVESIRTRKIIRETKKPYQRIDGVRYEDVTIYPLVANGVEGAVIRIDDVSKEYQLEEQLNHHSKMDAIGQLAGGVAHDFNNMLGGIIGAAQLLKIKKKKPDNQSPELEDIIIQASIRASELTAKLLAFGRKGKITSSSVDIHEIIKDTVTIFKGTIDKKIRLSIKKGAENHTITGDNSGLQNALLNIGINASHAMPDGGELHIETRNIHLNKTFCQATPFEIKPGKYIEIEIRDTGCGIPREDLQKIFEPFYTTKKQGKGTGLGLASVYGTLQDHQGSITVSSELGKGTSFYILLPCYDNAIKTYEIKPELLTGSGQILLVDDEKIIRLTGRLMMEKMGYNVLLAENGREAVE